MATDKLPVILVLDTELLFRSVADSAEHHTCDPEGNLRQVGQSAFNDRSRKPSVDRANLGAVAKTSRRSPEHGVVTLAAAEIRGIATVVTSDAKGRPIDQHAVDVIHVPEEQNHAHAQVEAAPHPDSRGAWMKLKEALCIIATRRGWTYPPASARDQSG